MHLPRKTLTRWSEDRFLLFLLTYFTSSFITTKRGPYVLVIGFWSNSNLRERGKHHQPCSRKFELLLYPSKPFLAHWFHSEFVWLDPCQVLVHFVKGCAPEWQHKWFFSRLYIFFIFVYWLLFISTFYNLYIFLCSFSLLVAVVSIKNQHPQNDPSISSKVHVFKLVSRYSGNHHRKPYHCLV